MKDLCISYSSFRNHEVRVWCKTNGSDGQFVLEDILKVLFPLDWERRLEEKVDWVRKEVSNARFLDGSIPISVYVAKPFVTREFYAYCDDTENTDIFNEFGSWLNKMCEFLEQDMALVAETHPKLIHSSEYVARVTEEGKANQVVTIDDWLRLEYGIDLPWLRTPITKIIDLMMGHGRRLTTGQSIPKTQSGTNRFRYRDFGDVYLEVNRLIAGETIFGRHNYRDKLSDRMDSSANTQTNNDALNEETRTLPFLGTNKSDDEIIRELWRTSQSSSPHQYALLQMFLDVVRKRQRMKVRQ